MTFLFIGIGIGVAAISVTLSASRDDSRPAQTPIAVSIPVERATCDDAVAGTWIADEYRRDHHDWIEHELHAARAVDGYIVEHTARVRSGDERGHAAMGCAPDAIEFDTVGRATLDGDRLRVWGTSLLTTRARCDGTTQTYDLDSFSGTLAGETFDSVNNDGNTAVNRPYHFRRIACV